MSDYKYNRDFMKSDFAESVHDISDQAKKVPYPPLQKPLPEGDVVLIDLPDPWMSCPIFYGPPRE